MRKSPFPRFISSSLFSILILLVLAFWVYKPFYNSLPQGVHSWGQADRYAVAERYISTGMDFTKTSTYNQGSENGRTGLELPVLQYMSAWLSLNFAPNHLAYIFRAINLLFFLFAFWFFIKEFRGPNFWLNSLTPLILFSSPILCFYAFNFLPDVTGLSFILIGYVFLFKFLENMEFKWIVWTLTIGTIGALIKLSSGIYLGASILFFLIAFYKDGFRKNKKKLALTFLLSSISMAVIFGYVYWAMIAVNEKYWSVVFRAHPNPVSNFTDLTDMLKGMGNWRTEYGSISLYIALIFSLSWLVYNIIKKQVKTKGLVLHSILVGIILLIFMWALGMQFINHDYYFISTFMPLIFLVVSYYLMIKLPARIKNKKWIVYSVISILSLASVFTISKKVPERMADKYKMGKQIIENNTAWLKSAPHVAANYGPPKGDMLFVLYHQSPNIPLVYFKREGMSFNHEELARKEEFIEYWLRKHEARYFLIQPEWIEQFKVDKPAIYQNMDEIYTGPDFSLYQSNIAWNEYLPKKKQ